MLGGPVLENERRRVDSVLRASDVEAEGRGRRSWPAKPGETVSALDTAEVEKNPRWNSSGLPGVLPRGLRVHWGPVVNKYQITQLGSSQSEKTGANAGGVCVNQPRGRERQYELILSLMQTRTCANLGHIRVTQLCLLRGPRDRDSPGATSTPGAWRLASDHHSSSSRRTGALRPSAGSWAPGRDRARWA